MKTLHDCESTLTDRYQTTVPELVRRALKLGKRDKIHYAIQPDASVLITRAEASVELDDPVLGQFLDFLEKDITMHPENVQALDAKWMERVRALIGHVEIDLDTPLSEDDE
ncbi:MAG: type II toxin-antitoxin system PrlF family antitoxin [Candidatus Methylumidiphilus sp.]